MHDKRLILLVDNNQEFYRKMKKLFGRSGYNVINARDGREAINLLSEKPFDLVISEVKMSGLDGIELMGEVNRRRVDLPVLFLTEHGEIESYMDLMNMGAFDYLNKPVREQELTTVVRQALKAGMSCSAR